MKKINIANKQMLIEIVLIFILCAICFFSFNHDDLTITSTHGYKYLLLIAKGRFFDFYDAITPIGIYLIPIYIIFAIWSIPVAIVYKLFGFTPWNLFETSPGVAVTDIPYWTLMWYKLLPCLFCIATAFVLYKILKNVNIGDYDKNVSVILFLGCPILVYSQFCYGQYDSIGMFFTLLAVYYFLQKKYYMFSILMGVAICFKMFSLLLLIPLLLLSQNNIRNTIKFFVIAIIPYLFFNLIFIWSDGFLTGKEFAKGLSNKLFETGIVSLWGILPLFVLGYILVCFYAFIRKPNSDEDFYRSAIFVCLCSYSVLFSFLGWNPQWPILIVPFLILAFAFSKHKNLYLLALLGLSVAYLLMALTGGLASAEGLLNLGLFGEFCGVHFTNGTISSLLISKIPMGVWAMTFIAFLTIIGYLSAPLKDKKIIQIFKDSDNKIFFSYQLVYLLSIFVWIIPVGAYLIKHLLV